MSIIRVPQDVPTINDAVFLSEAGDTIIVCSGVYKESVTIPEDKPKLRIKGDPKAKPVLEGVCYDGGDSGFEVDANGVYISNFLIKGGYAYGIKINGRDCTVDNCEIRNCKTGILVSEESEGGNLFNCVKCIGNERDGMTINGDNSCIIECTCEKNGNNGITISGGNTLVLNCTLSYNLNNGIEIEEDNGQCLFNLIIGCNIQCNLNNGIKSKLGRTFILNNFIAKNGDDGIDIRDTDLNSVVKNKIEYNLGDGVDIDDGMLNKIIFNKVICNVGNGVAIGDDGTENFVDDNTFITNNKAGVILLRESSDKQIQRKIDKDYKRRKDLFYKETKKSKELKKKYNKMLEKIEEWIPPTSDHIELKNFMKKQIEMSFSDCEMLYSEKDIIKLPLEQYKYEQEKSLLDDLDYYMKEWVKETKRTSDRNLWIKQLRDSLK